MQLTDNLLQVGTAGTLTSLAAPGKALGASSINLTSAGNYPTTATFILAIRQVNSSLISLSNPAGEVPGTYCEYIAMFASGTTFTINPTPVYGTDQTYSAGTTTQVFIPASAIAWNKLITTLLLQHNQDGSHGAVTAASLASTGSVTANGVDVQNRNLYDNAIINGGCLVAQRAVPTLSTSYQYSQVDRLAVMGSGTAVSAGTAAQTTTPNATTLGAALKLSGVTITGSGVLYVRYRMEAKDAQYFKNAACSFSAKVYQATGGALNYTIYIRKPTVADNFSSTTNIANSGAISVPSGAATQIKFENINTGNIGDVSNGIEIEIQVACGAITTQNFEFAEFELNLGPKAASFKPRAFELELRACQRYFEKGFTDGTTPASGTQVNTHNGSSPTGLGGVYCDIAFKAVKRGTPTITTYGTSGANWEFFDGSWQTRGGTGTNIVDTTFFQPLIASSTGLTGFNDKFPYLMRGNWTADAEL